MLVLLFLLPEMCTSVSVRPFPPPGIAGNAARRSWTQPLRLNSRLGKTHFYPSVAIVFSLVTVPEKHHEGLALYS